MLSYAKQLNHNSDERTSLCPVSRETLRTREFLRDYMKVIEMSRVSQRSQDSDDSGESSRVTLSISTTTNVFAIESAPTTAIAAKGANDFQLRGIEILLTDPYIIASVDCRSIWLQSVTKT